MIVEGDTQKEKDSCQLAKELIISKGGEAAKNGSDLVCLFEEQYNANITDGTVIVTMEVGKNHPEYKTFLQNKEANQEPALFGVLAEENIVLNGVNKEIFIKDDNGFRPITNTDQLKLIKKLDKQT